MAWTMAAGWLLVAILFTLLLATYLVLFSQIVRRIRSRRRDRYRRKFRQGKWVPRCDGVLRRIEPGPGGVGVTVVTEPWSQCDRLAHYMVISPDTAWGTGAKKCWRHYDPSFYRALGMVVMPVNRKTAWADDPPPKEQEEAVNG